MQINGRLLPKVNKDIAKDLLDISKRLARKDSTIWGANTEAPTRLNWVDLPVKSRELMPELDSLSAWARTNKLEQVILCGMGGSSLAAEVIAAAYKKELIVLDSTHPAQVLKACSTDLHRSVIIIGSKSGTTIETTSHLKFFNNKLTELGLAPKDHLVIITDPDTPLDISSRQQGLRVINGDPNVGGRYSALSAFGLVPAALMGIDVSVLLDDAEALSQILVTEQSPAIPLACLLFTETKQFINMCDFNSRLPGLSDWIEQLVAESTGKNHQGRLPVVIENPSSANKDLVIGFSAGDFDLNVQGTLGEQFILWEWVTALLCYLLNVDPFNQPNVAEAKEPFGWGPRFLHSTGQIHKGGQPNGCFIQITSDIEDDLPIPNEKFTFGNLLMAQALGDAAALGERNFPLMRIHLKDNKTGIKDLMSKF